MKIQHTMLGHQHNLESTYAHQRCSKTRPTRSTQLEATRRLIGLNFFQTVCIGLILGQHHVNPTQSDQPDEPVVSLFFEFNLIVKLVLICTLDNYTIAQTLHMYILQVSSPSLYNLYIYIYIYICVCVCMSYIKMEKRFKIYIYTYKKAL